MKDRLPDSRSGSRMLREGLRKAPHDRAEGLARSRGVELRNASCSSSAIMLRPIVLWTATAVLACVVPLTLACSATSTADAPGAHDDATSLAASEPEIVDVTTAAATATDSRGFWKAFRHPSGTTLVELLGPPTYECYRPIGYPGCPVARLDFREAGLAPERVDLVLRRVQASTDAETTTSVLFKGRIVDVTVRDHRTDTTTVERRFFASAVYLAPTVNVHAATFFFLYTRDSGQQMAVRAAIQERVLPSPATLSWSGMPSPGAPLDDVVVAAAAVDPSPTGLVAITANQVFLRER